MSKTSVSQWSTTADNNTDIGGIDINEGSKSSDVNNAIREIMAQIASYAAGEAPSTSVDPTTLTDYAGDNLLYNGLPYYWTGTTYAAVTSAGQLTSYVGVIANIGDDQYFYTSAGTYELIPDTIPISASTADFQAINTSFPDGSLGAVNGYNVTANAATTTPDFTNAAGTKWVYSGPNYPSVDAIRASQVSHVTGQVMTAEDKAFRVVDSGTYTADGQAVLTLLDGKQAASTEKAFLDRTATTAALLAANLSNGEIGWLDGLMYRKNDTATGALSATGIDLAQDFLEPPKYAPLAFEHFGAVRDGVTDDSEAINRAFAYCVDNDRTGASSGTYKALRTIQPNGRVSWDFRETVFDFGGATTADLVEVMENPSGSAVLVGSGKYALFDTKGMVFSILSGNLTIQGTSSLGDMTLANRANIMQDVVAITATEGSSAQMTFGSLLIRGCANAFYQGAMNGTGPNVLPYTGWSGRFLHVQFCGMAFESGAGGNGFDDWFWSEIRTQRNADNGFLRTTGFGFGQWFMYGMSRTFDIEAQTVSVTAGSTTANLSADNADMPASGTIAILDASETLDNTNAIPLVTRYTKAGTVLTLETAPEATVTSNFIVDPPSLILDQAKSNAGSEFYVEGTHDFGVRLLNRSGIRGTFKYSNGDLGCRHAAPIVMGGLLGGNLNIDISPQSINGMECKSAVAIVPLRTAASGEGNSGQATIRSPARKSFWGRSEVARVVAPESDEIFSTALDGANVLAGQDFNVRIVHDDADYKLHVGREGLHFGVIDGEQPAVLTPTADGVTGGATGSGGAFDFPAGAGLSTAFMQYGATGFLGGKRLRVRVNVSAFTGTTGGNPVGVSGRIHGFVNGNVQQSTDLTFEWVGSDGWLETNIEIPAGSNCNGIGIRFNHGAAPSLTTTDFIVEEYLDRR